MFLSFIVPVYNVEKYLAECLDSLLDQDIPHVDYEIICVNDGSTDSSLEILRTYEKAHANIRVIDQKNAGVATARNVGLDAARGEYIWFVDPDDMIKRNSLAFLKNHLQETQAERVRIGIYMVMDRITDEELDALTRGELQVNMCLYDSSSVNCIISRDFLTKHGCRFQYPELTHGEDSIFMFEVVGHRPKFSELNIPLYIYRRRAGSATNVVTPALRKRQLDSFFIAGQIMKKHYDNGFGDPRDTANLLMSYIWYVMDGCAKLPGKERREMVRKMKDLGLYPFRRPEACSHVRSYQTTRTDIVGKIFDKVYIHLHRPWGFAAMVVLHKLIGLKKKLVK